ncbi:hypothetical protein E2C01_037488 [Portunus trituberculatus]|uniref:Uncharacterized protein n=1 Tax=Portunus trituberculatus TaxID=210409 RepID=A0A5B7FE88_PORTR|nr:hypothetical protein [Portunus trituberculatus]
MLVQTTSIATSSSQTNLRKIASTKIRCCWWVEELDPRNFNNVRATSCREITSMNAWRDGNEVVLRLLGKSPLKMVLLSYNIRQWH